MKGRDNGPKDTVCESNAGPVVGRMLARRKSQGAFYQVHFNTSGQLLIPKVIPNSSLSFCQK